MANAYFATQGLYALVAAHAQLARQSHVRPHQLESRMRENRPSGSEGGGELPLSPYPYPTTRKRRGSAGASPSLPCSQRVPRLKRS